jgi:hypothetical protein
VRPIGAVAETGSRKASVAATGGPCKCTSSAYATTRTSGNVSRTLFEGALQGQGKEQGTAGIPLAHTTLRGERGRVCGYDQRTTNL